MTGIDRRHGKSDIARRGEAMYERNVVPKLKGSDRGKFAAIDIDTGDFEIGVNELSACHRLMDRLPKAQIWLVRIGSPYLYHFGGHDLGGRP